MPSVWNSLPIQIRFSTALTCINPASKYISSLLPPKTPGVGGGGGGGWGGGQAAVAVFFLLSLFVTLYIFLHLTAMYSSTFGKGWVGG